MKRTTVGAGIGVALGCCLGLVALPSAALIPPNSDELIVRDATGAIFAQVSATEADELTNGPDFIYLIPNVAVDVSQFGNFTSLFEIAGDPNSTGDVFGIAFGVPGCLTENTYCLVFASDVDGQTFPFGPGPNNFFDNGGVFSATQYLSADLQGRGWTATFQSDGQPTTPTLPEPGTLALMGIGAAVLGLRRKVHS